jgi:hypothetical protein
MLFYSALFHAHLILRDLITLRVLNEGKGKVVPVLN